MDITTKERLKAERKLRKWGVEKTDIESFEFMKRYTPHPDRHSRENLYGPGLLILHLRNGSDCPCVLHARHDPTSIVRYLVAEGIRLANLDTPAVQMPPAKAVRREYRRPSLYMFWHTIVFLLLLAGGLYCATRSDWGWGALVAAPLLAGAIYWLYLLQTRFCYVALDGESLHVCSTGREVTLPLSKMLKVNFDFAREANFTHVMEVLDTDLRYRLFYIGRTPRTQLRRIVTALRRSGIDATCSLNDEKRHYEDVYHLH